MPIPKEFQKGDAIEYVEKPGWPTERVVRKGKIENVNRRADTMHIRYNDYVVVLQTEASWWIEHGHLRKVK